MNPAAVGVSNLSPGQYSKSRTLSVRKAMATALARHIATLRFPGGKGFTQVFTDWPAYEGKYVPPTAVVMPKGSWIYEDALMSPTLLENTTEPIDPGTGEMVGAGWGLYKLAEVTMPIEITFACQNNTERDNVLEFLEDTFVAAGVLMNEIEGPRYGIIVPMPEYYGLPCRFALSEGRVLDDLETAMRDKREAVLTISAQAPHVTLGPVRPLILTVTKEIL